MTSVLPFSVCIMPEAPANSPRSISYPGYVHEILRHAGLAYSTVAAEELTAALPDLRLLLTVGEASLPTDTLGQLRAWVQAGGAWLSIAGTCGAPELFGVKIEPPAYSGWGATQGTLGEGYLFAHSGGHAALSHVRVPLHHFNGLPVRSVDGDCLAGVLDAHWRSTSRAAVTEMPVGRGRCLLIAPDLTGAVVRIQQGIAITRDGVPAPDGTAPTADAVLKSDDGAVLDWIFDRQSAPGIPGLAAFLQPVADHWRELLLRAIFHLAVEQHVALPAVWLYPRNLPALGHLSHDSDGNDSRKAERLLELLTSADVASTWCVLAPGYTHEVITKIRQAGHELAMHFDAMSPGSAWDEGEFDRQWSALVRLFGARPVTNKNHYLRWEGDSEFFEWCVRRGLQVDESKGASKTGAAGFNFGTCHPYFPTDPRGRTMDVLEIPTPTQDLEVFAPTALADSLLAAARASHGVSHFLFHPQHIETPGVAEALLYAVEKGRQQGLEWWTASRINSWERARRKVEWHDSTATAERAAIRLRVTDSLPAATILWLAPYGGRAAINGAAREAVPTERWGYRFHAVTVDLQANNEYILEAMP